ncbi:MAG: excinuclease ABC subunit UvrC [Deltaproteobacteria bacterium]|nr:excinuclease ABC subunit UvrC [Deltaproteobacteria bacterium]
MKNISAELESKENLKEFLKNLPHSPGVYIMKGRKEKVLYVGKAVDLKNRVSSYFRRGGDGRYFISRLNRELHHIEILLVKSEKEALLLENNLIKELKPKYNINLRDDKTYPGIEINTSSEFPRIQMVRGLKRRDNVLYFGPYHSSRNVKAVLAFIQKFFRFRTCTDRSMKSRKRPCLQYHMKRCDAPCCNLITSEEYNLQLEHAIMFLKNENTELVETLKREMLTLSEKMEYERAARIRDLLFALNNMAQAQNAISSDFMNRDVIGIAIEGEQTCLLVLEVRRGSITTHHQTVFENPGFPDEEIMESFILQHYTARKDVPDEILIPGGFEISVETSDAVSEKTGKKAIILTPDTQHLNSLMDLAVSSARNTLQLSFEYDIHSQLSALASRLKVKWPIHRMECYDISHHQGKAAVGSMVVFIDGAPVRSLYRTFNLRTTKAGDDYAALREVMRRRLSHRDEKNWELPDLIVIDGGMSQLKSVISVFRSMDIHFGTVPPVIISLAKQRDADGAPDRFFIPEAKEPVHVRGGGRELLLLSAIRDEAHRHAIESHRKISESNLLKLSLENIPGVGRKRAMELLKKFRSIEEIKKATPEEIAQIPALNLKTATVILEFLSGIEDTEDEPNSHN